MEAMALRGRWAGGSVARLYLCDALAQLPSLTGESCLPLTVLFGQPADSGRAAIPRWGTWKEELMEVTALAYGQ